MYEPGKEFVLDPHSSFLPTLSNDLGIVSQRIHWFNAQVFPGIVTKYTQKIIILKKKKCGLIFNDVIFSIWIWATEFAYKIYLPLPHSPTVYLNFICTLEPLVKLLYISQPQTQLEISTLLILFLHSL